MTRATFFAYLLLAGLPAWGAEPLAGLWHLTSQDVAGKKGEADSLTLRIVPSSNGFDFAYSIPVNDVQFVSMSFSSRLDGNETDVKDSQGKKIGSIKISRSGPSQYAVTLQGANRPTASSKITVSPDGKTMQFETESNAPGRGAVHTVQVFERQ